MLTIWGQISHSLKLVTKKLGTKSWGDTSDHEKHPFRTSKERKHDRFCMSNSFLGISLEISLCRRLTRLLNDLKKLQLWGFLHHLPQAEVRLLFIPPWLLPSIQCDVSRSSGLLEGHFAVASWRLVSRAPLRSNQREWNLPMTLGESWIRFSRWFTQLAAVDWPDAKYADEWNQQKLSPWLFPSCRYAPFPNTFPDKTQNHWCHY